jgi:hypothetical protein
VKALAMDIGLTLNNQYFSLTTKILEGLGHGDKTVHIPNLFFESYLSFVLGYHHSPVSSEVLP